MPRRRKVPVEEQKNEVPVAKKKNLKEKPAKKFKREPEWMIGDGVNVVKLILSIQKTDCNNTKVIAELTKLYSRMGQKTFMAAFMKIVLMFLTREDNDEYAQRVIKFLGTFVASFGEDVGEDGGSHPIIQNVFDEILSMTSKQFYVRARICQLVTHIMCSFSQKAEIDETIMDKVIERMLGTFIKDISPVVRQNAIMALQRLQDPENSEDQVTRAYIYHMETDPVAKVRQAAITAIAKKLQVFPHILDRLSDNDEKVRRHTYLQMASVPVKSYKISDRIKIMLAGLYDRSEMVKKAVLNILVPNWIAAYENDFTEFIKAIKLDANDNELIRFRGLAQDALIAIFKKRQVNELVTFLNLTKENQFRNCLSFDKANCLEWLIVWKIIIKIHQDYVKGKHGDECDEENDSDKSDAEHNDTVSNVDIIPELTTFCDFIEKFMDEFKVTTESEAKYQKLNFNHCIILLLEIAQLNDLGDVIGCSRLKQVLKKILVEHDVSEFVIKEVIHVNELLTSSVDERLKFCNDIAIETLNLDSPSEYSRQTIVEEIISRVDINTKVEANSLKMEMMELKEQENTFVEQKQYADAHKVSEKYVQLNEELIELLRPFADQTESSTLNLVDTLSSVVVAKKVSPSVVLKNLRICFYAVMVKGVKKITPEILKTYKTFVRYHLESADTSTRVWALKTATAYSLLYQPIANEVYVILKSQMFKSNNVSIWEASIVCIIDLLLRYSVEKMEQQNEKNQEMSVNDSQTNRTNKKSGRTLYTDDGEDAEELDIVDSIDIIQMLMHVLDNNVDKKVHKATVIGLCKLILHGQYYTREIVSKFMIAYFNPATDAEVNQILGIFFESIIRMKKQESLQEALVPTLVTLLEAPYDSPLREVKQETVVKYVIGATRPIFCSNGLNLHNTLGLKLIELMKENLDNKEIHKVLSKELLMLEIGDDPLLKKDMIVQIEWVLDNITADVRTRKNISDFRDILNGTYKPPLKFSSTAMTTNLEDDEDAGNAEEADVDEPEPTVNDAAERINFSEIIDMSLAEGDLCDLVVNVTKLNSLPDDSIVKSPNAHKLADNTEKDCKTLVDETQVTFRETSPTATQDVDIPATQDVDIPATQAEEENEENAKSSDSDSDCSMNETVIESHVIPNNSEDEVSIPPTPETPQTRGKKIYANKRQLELSLSINSPMRKNPRNGQSPKPTVQSPKSSSLRKSLTVSTPVTKNKSLSAPVTPKSSKIALSKPSTPNTERTTRKQAKEDLAQIVTLTRSASKKLNVDPKEVAKKAIESSKARKAEKKESPPKVDGKQLKKTALPLPTKASTLRAARLESAAQKQDVSKRTARTTATEATAPTKEPAVAIIEPRISRRQAIATRNLNAAKKGTDTKQRPRWA